MPVYEYKCEKCGKKYDTMMSMSENAPDKLECPACKTDEHSHRVFVKTPVKFKGRGWAGKNYLP